MSLRHVTIEGGSEPLRAAIARIFHTSPRLEEFIVTNPPGPQILPERLTAMDQRTIEESARRLTQLHRSVRLPVIPENPPVYLRLAETEEVVGSTSYSMSRACQDMDEILVTSDDVLDILRDTVKSARELEHEFEKVLSP